MNGQATGFLARLRITRRLIAMAALLFVALIGFYGWGVARFLRLASAPNPWPRRFLGGIGRIAGVRVQITGRAAPGRLLMLANHVSWIDIPALAGVTGTAFVAHDGLAEVALLKWLCTMNDTVFVARGHRASISAQIGTLRNALADRGIVTIFPEGTTSDGSTLLPFKSALLAAIDPPPADIAVQPVWLDYGALIPTIAWVGDEPGVANFKRILARAEPLDLTIHFLDPLSAGALRDRKSMAAAAHHAITTALQNRKVLA